MTELERSRQDPAPANGFCSLGLPGALVKALKTQSIDEPTAIQAAAIPAILAAKDVYLEAETGTGKTLAYLLPLFCRMTPDLPATQTLILAPTHELAIQIQRQCADLAQHSGIPLRTILLIGGTSKDRQLEKLKKKPHIIVGSPGRILELIAAGKVKTHKLVSIVVDEADRLLQDESREEILETIQAAPSTRQLIFVSATSESSVAAFISSVTPALVAVRTGAAPVNKNIDHLYAVCEERDKPDLLRSMLHAFQPERALVFVHRNETAEIVAAKLSHHSVSVADLHGARRKEDRKRAMDDFRSGKARVLIASDVAARGLDIKGVTHVFNFDPPTESKAYLHRVGRTARAGAHGVAVSLIAGPQVRVIRRLRDELGIDLRKFVLRNGEVRIVEPQNPGAIADFD